MTEARPIIAVYARRIDFVGAPDEVRTWLDVLCGARHAGSVVGGIEIASGLGRVSVVGVGARVALADLAP